MSRKKTTPSFSVRRLHSFERDQICAHFLRLDPQSRRARFCGTISDAGITQYVRDIFHHNSIICGAFDGGELRGLVELRGVFRTWVSATEAAFSVEQEWQNIGIGDALFDHIFAIARNRGVKTIQMICLKENVRMKHLAQKHHALVDFDQDAVEAVLHPHWPTPVSVAKEIIGETTGFVHFWFHRRPKSTAREAAA